MPPSRGERSGGRTTATAGAPDLLQVIAGRGAMRPSDIAAPRLVHPSLATRQVSEFEAAGTGARGWVTLTPAGEHGMLRRRQVGLDRCGGFVADCRGRDVQALAALLERLRAAMAAVHERGCCAGPDGCPAASFGVPMGGWGRRSPTARAAEPSGTVGCCPARGGGAREARDRVGDDASPIPCLGPRGRGRDQALVRRAPARPGQPRTPVHRGRRPA